MKYIYDFIYDKSYALSTIMYNISRWALKKSNTLMVIE